MTRLLAIETSGAVGSVAVANGATVLERAIATPREQTDVLLPIVAELLAATGLTLGTLDAVVFGRGPGSFTGLRIAAAAAQGLSLAAGLPVVGVSSLAAVLQRAHDEGGVARALVAIDARMGEVYSGVFEIRRGRAEPVLPERLGAPAELTAPPWDDWSALGDAFARFSADLAPLAARATRVDAAIRARARDLLPMARADLAAGRVLTPSAALPTYLRDDSAWRRP